MRDKNKAIFIQCPFAMWAKMRCRHECVNRIATSHLAITFFLQSMCVSAYVISAWHCKQFSIFFSRYHWFHFILFFFNSISLTPYSDSFSHVSIMIIKCAHVATWMLMVAVQSQLSTYMHSKIKTKCKERKRRANIAFTQYIIIMNEQLHRCGLSYFNCHL